MALSAKTGTLVKRALVAVVALAVVAVVLVRFGVVDRVLGGASSPLEEALALLPASADQVIYADAAATRGRLGLDVVRGELDSSAYLEATRQAPWVDPLGVPALGAFVRAMDGGAWSALDVTWSAQATLEGGGVVSVFEVGGEVDVDEVAGELGEHGFEESEVAGNRSFELVEHSALGDYALLPTVTFVGGGIVVVASVDARDDAVAVADGDGDSLLDAGTFDEVADVEDVEFGVLARGARLCGMPAEGVPGEVPEASAAYVVADGDDARGLARLAYDGGGDVADRESYLTEGTSTRTGRPLADEVDDVEVTADGDVVEVSFTAGPVARLHQLITYGVVTACGAEPEAPAD